MRDTLSLVVYLFYCFESGVFLVIVPWSRVWPRNYFFERWPLTSHLTHPMARGLISGVGVALLVHGVDELVTAVRSRRRGGDSTHREAS